MSLHETRREQAAGRALGAAGTAEWPAAPRPADIPRNPVPLVFAVLHANARAAIFARDNPRLRCLELATK